MNAMRRLILFVFATLLLLAPAVAWAAGPNPRGTLRIEATVTEVRVVTDGDATTVLLFDAVGCIQLVGPDTSLVTFCEPVDAFVTGTSPGTQKWFAFTRPLEPDNGSVLVVAQSETNAGTAFVFRCVRKSPRLTVCRP